MTTDGRKRGGPRENRMAIPPEVVPKVDALIAQGHFYSVIARQLGCDPQTISKIKRRIGAYARYPI